MSTADDIHSRLAEDPSLVLRARDEIGFGLRRDPWEAHELAVARHVSNTRVWTTIVRAQRQGVAAGCLIARAPDRELLS
jgi:hypothetical protein